jgi:hypothetical protein
MPDAKMQQSKANSVPSNLTRIIPANKRACGENNEAFKAIANRQLALSRDLRREIGRERLQTILGPNAAKFAASGLEPLATEHRDQGEP